VGSASPVSGATTGTVDDVDVGRLDVVVSQFAAEARGSEHCTGNGRPNRCDDSPTPTALKTMTLANRTTERRRDVARRRAERDVATTSAYDLESETYGVTTGDASR
jgi:hypothetical protein